PRTAKKNSSAWTTVRPYAWTGSFPWMRRLDYPPVARLVVFPPHPGIGGRMFGKPIKLFRLTGVDVRIHFSWFLLLLLITWSLAAGFFPMRFPGLSTGLFWALGFAGAMGLFLSILLHEISHSVVGRHFGMKMEGITLFLLGGVAEMPNEPQRPKAEFWMAIAGPM